MGLDAAGAAVGGKTAFEQGEQIGVHGARQEKWRARCGKDG
jgi:hypothetical protein